MSSGFSEKTLRQWARTHLQVDGNMLMWVEPSAGSTVGMPDLILVTGRRVVFLELKIAAWKRSGRWVYPAVTVRPSQNAWHRAAVDAGLLSGFLVGLAPPPELTPPDAVADIFRPKEKAEKAEALWKRDQMAAAMLSSAEYRRWATTDDPPTLPIVGSWEEARNVLNRWIADAELAD
jgi:hypothetical protein